jgi:DNA-binding NarL/FixJ family response regulator
VSLPAVLVVDDHLLFAEVVSRSLRRSAKVADARPARSVREAREAVETRTTDVVLLDPDLGGESGLDLITHLDALPARPRVVLVADAEDHSSLVDALSAGVQGWLSKESSLEELLRAVEAVHRGDVHLPPHAWSPTVLDSLRARGTEPASGRQPLVEVLTHRQRQVLACLVAGLARAEIAQALGVSPHTVRTHVRDMLRVAGVHSTPHLVARARAEGLRPDGAASSASPPGH